MKPLLSAAGEDALFAVLRNDPLVALDFDGTLSPMVALPWQARMPAGVSSGLRQLCDMLPVAVITGRSVEDVTPRLPAMPKYVVGNHGAEGVPGDEGNATAYRAVCESWMQQIRDELRWESLDSGLMVEHKPTSICVHYRLLRDRSVIRGIEDSVSQLRPLPQVIGGKYGINLLPPGAPTKRHALETLLRIEGKSAAIYIGDDETDEVVFRDAPAEWLTVRVGHEAGSAARFFLRHQSEMTECLHALVKLVQVG